MDFSAQGMISEFECCVSCRMPSRYGMYRLHMYPHGGKDHLALVFGAFHSKSLNKNRPGDSPDERLRRGAVPVWPLKPAATSLPVLVRIHSCCFTGEAVGSERCDCGEQLEKSLKLMGDANAGVLVYLKQEGRNIGLKQKLL
jgi:GTP cyclohydrolase II